jgi:four helix bundle protein
VADFHDIKERSFGFATQIVRLCAELESAPNAAPAIVQALMHAGTHLGLHVEEAHSGHAKPEFIAHMASAAQEARATLYWLRLLEADNNSSPKELSPISDECLQLVAILSSIVKRSREPRT